MNTAFDPSVDGSRSTGVKGQGQYGCTLDELKTLMTLHGQEAYHKLQDDYKPGGVLEICRRLRTSPVDGNYLQFPPCLFLCPKSISHVSPQLPRRRGSFQLVTDLLASRPTSPQQVVVMKFGKRHDTTDTTDFCPRQLVMDLLHSFGFCHVTFGACPFKNWGVVTI